MTRRSESASFAPNAFVFPGGALDDADSAEPARRLSIARHDQDHEQRAFSVAAIREAFEELGVLLAYRPDGSLATHDDVLALDRDAGFFEQVDALGLRLAVDRVRWLCRWVTDPDLPKRFDARFFLARMPEGQQPLACERETFEPTWLTPRRALERHEAGEFEMLFPTVRTLRRLAQFGDVDALLRACGDVPLWSSRPRGAPRGGDIQRFSEHEPAYGELELVVPDGRLLHALDWQHERPVPLTRNLQRLTATNPGMMTGPGTNTYIVGEPGAYAVIDPGPEDPAHVERIARLVGDDLRYIICTHAHPDHAPGAFLLKQVTGLPVIGTPTGPHFRWDFTPDRVLADGERLALGDTTLRVIYTPGHTSNHVCLLMEEDRLLLAGDHLANGTTVVIEAPDGNMSDYLASLRRLLDEPIDYVLPAHGHVIGAAHDAIRHVIAHRLGREKKVRAALAAAGSATIEALLPRVYDDVNPALHPVAMRSLLAHLVKLAADGVATEHDGLWQAV